MATGTVHRPLERWIDVKCACDCLFHKKVHKMRYIIGIKGISYHQLHPATTSLYHLVSSCSNLISFSPSFWPMTSGNKPWRLALVAAESQPSSQQLLPHSKSCRGKWDRHRFGKVVRARGVWFHMTHPLVLSFAFKPSADRLHTFFAVHWPSKNIQVLNQWLFSWMESGSNSEQRCFRLGLCISQVQISCIMSFGAVGSHSAFSAVAQRVDALRQFCSHLESICHQLSNTLNIYKWLVSTPIYSQIFRLKRRLLKASHSLTFQSKGAKTNLLNFSRLM